MMRPSAELGFARTAADVLEDEGVAPSPSLSEEIGQLGSLAGFGCGNKTFIPVRTRSQAVKIDIRVVVLLEAF